MTLTDTGPLIALIDASDPNHQRCEQALTGLPRAPLFTTWPCLTEAMYMLGKSAGHAGQDELWGFLEDGLVVLHSDDAAERARMRVLMGRYQDTPMDLADASLVATAETQNLRRIFTLDRHFYAYRIGEGPEAKSFEVVP